LRAKNDLPMRLGQLARKLSVSPAEVTAFLAGRNIQIEEGINTRLTDEQLTSVLQHYGKVLSTVTLAEEPAIEEGTATKPEEQTNIIVQEPVQEASSSMAEQSVDQVVISDSIAPQAGMDIMPEAGVSADEGPTLIKAPKVELSGLRILGKIELPQPKKKEALEKQGEAGTEKLESPVSKDRRESIREDRGSGRRQPRNREGERLRKNPVAAQREREARAAEEIRQELARQEKERRTQYYQQRVKASVPTKPARLFNEEVADMKNDRKPAPKGWFGRLLRWFKS
jgi:hypothetical protein